MGTRKIRFLAGAGAALGLAVGVAGCERQTARDVSPEPPRSQTLARADLFGDPARDHARLSPRGDSIAFLAPRDGVMNLWVMAADGVEEPRPLTDERNRGVSEFFWAAESATLVYAQNAAADDAQRLFAVSAAGGEPRALTPEGANAAVLGASARDPNRIIVSLKPRDRDWADVVSVDVRSGEQQIVLRNTEGFTRFVLTRDGDVALGVRPIEGGAAEVAARQANGGWRVVIQVPFEDAMSSRPLAMDADGRSFLMLDSTGRDRAALVRVDIATGAKAVLGESERADVADVWFDPATQAPEAFATEYLRREWRALDVEAQADLDFLDGQLGADFEVVSRSADDGRWIVIEEGPTTPPRSYVYDRLNRAERRLSLLFRHRPALEGAPLQAMTPVEIAARDGLNLVSYLTLPAGADPDGDARPSAPAPLVVTALSSPWSRESFRFNALHQWLANRGYAVLSVNTRGSSGFGKAFLNAGNREWGGRVQDDLLDAAQWAIDNRVAAPNRVAIVGSGFGGYAALAGMTFHPDRFRCGASFGGFANLFSWIERAPAPMREALYARVGDPRTAEGRQTLRAQSPLFHAGQIRNPLLLAFGAEDRAVSRAESDQAAQAVRARSGGLTYMMFPDEGRALLSAQNRLSYFAVLEHFLGDCLGGRVEPVGAAFEGANLEVYDGAVNVPGLSAFVRRPAPRRAAPQPVVAPGEAPDTLFAPSIEPAEATP